MKLSQGFIHFNKEILSGEIGAITGAQLAGFLIRNSHLNNSLMSLLVVLGSVLGSGIFYLLMRIHHQKKKADFSVKKFSSDLLLYSIAAIFLTVTVYYPLLYFLDKHLFSVVAQVNLAVLIAQTLAFLCFLLMINLYRFVLKTVFDREQ